MTYAQIDEELRASGVTQVIVVLKTAGKAAAAAADPNELKKHFVKHPLSLASALELESKEQRRMAMAAAAGRAGTSPVPVTKVAPAPPMRYYPNLGVVFGAVTRKGLNGLRADRKRVQSVHAAPQFSLIRPHRVAAAALTTPVTWGIDALQAPVLWDKGFTGSNVLVGHLDTGADGQHPALRDAIAMFAEFDLMGRQIDPAPAPFDTDEHGTHTAGTIAGRPVNGNSIGVAPGARLASAIVIEGGQVVARVLGGMDWALGNSVRILSMSLGFPGMQTDFLPLTQILRSRNVLPVFAVGNEGPGTSRSPGNYAEATSIGAMDSSRRVASFSSSQRFLRTQDPIVPDLIAPGVEAISAKPGGGFQSMDGTSMATPHSAGLAALLIQAKPDATVDQVESAIFRSCARPPGVSKSRANRGFPNAPRALSLL